MRDFEVTDNYIVANECAGLNRDGDVIYRSIILLNKETFVEAYNKWIKGETNDSKGTETGTSEIS